MDFFPLGIIQADIRLPNLTQNSLELLLKPERMESILEQRKEIQTNFQPRSIRVQRQSSTQMDREKLELFAYSILDNTLLGYSLFGEKPISIDTSPVVTQIPLPHSFYFTMSYAHFPYWQGWEIWER